jgi:hypothetical protein
MRPAYRIRAVPHGKGPDFRLYGETDMFGLEVTEVFKDAGHKGSALKAAERERQDFLGAVSQHYYESGGRPVLVQVNFRGKPATDNIQAISRLIHGISRTLPPGSHREVKIGLGSIYITALYPKAGKYRRWVCINNSMSIGDYRLDAEFLQDVVATKAVKMDAYRKGVKSGRVALLVVADVTFNSSRVRLLEGPMTINTMGFSAVYFLQYPEEAVELARDPANGYKTLDSRCR